MFSFKKGSLTPNFPLSLIRNLLLIIQAWLIIKVSKMYFTDDGWWL